MNVTNKQYQTIEEVIQILLQGKHFTTLTETEQSTVLNANTIMMDLQKKKEEGNKKNAKLIAEKRKSNPNYCRTLDENGKQKGYYKKKN